MRGWLEKRAVERLLGVRLPAGATELCYARWQPSTDLALHEVCMKFRATRDDWLDLARRRGLTMFDAGRPGPYLPSRWQVSPGAPPLDFWDASPETPADAASGAMGSQGWIIAKHERDWVYVMVRDTGVRP
jgi:hypothetical protein